MVDRILSWICGLVVGIGCFAGSLLAVAAVAGAAIGPPKPDWRRETHERSLR